MPEHWILKGERDSRYVLYIEAYALDYIKKKENASALFLYGKRQAGIREQLFIYGASYTSQDNELFAPYEVIKELHACTYGGKVTFEISEHEGVYRIKGYYIFYEDNPTMKQWMVREEGYARKPALEACEAETVRIKPSFGFHFGTETLRGRQDAHPNGRCKDLYSKGKRSREEKSVPERIVDFGLIAILLTLLSVVIDTLNSPLKMGAFVEHLQQIQKMLKR